MRHDFCDGKYTVINENGNLTALRNGEPWGRDLVGDNLVYWMLVEVDRLKAEMATLLDIAGSGRQVASDTHCSPEVLQELTRPGVVRYEIRGENGDLLEVSVRSGPAVHAKWGAAFDAELQAHPGIRKLADGSKP